MKFFRGWSVLISVFVLLVLWEVLSRFGPWPSSLFPPPEQVAQRMVVLARDGRLTEASLQSLGRLGRGFGLSVLVGLPLGIAMARVRWVRNLTRPLVMGLQALPSICWLPLALLWFGLTDLAIIFVVVMGSALAIAIATEDAVSGVEPNLLRVASSFGLKGRRFVLGVLIPAALPGLLTGLKLGWSFAWRALLAGELLYVSGGLGELLTVGRELMEPAQVIAVMIAIILIGVTIDRVLFRSVELRVRRRYGLEAP